MLHTTDPKGSSAFVTPLVMKGKGKDAVNVNLVGGNKFALNIAYIAIASKNIITAKDANGNEFVKDNRLTNVTVRTAVAEIHEAIKLGNPADTFILHDVKVYADRENYGDITKWQEGYTVTRGDLLKTCDDVSQINAIMVEAEKKADAIAVKHKTGVKVVNDCPVYYTADGATKAKRGGGKTFVSI